VTDSDFGVVWDPNIEDSFLIAEGWGETQLWLPPRDDDPETRAVVLVWKGTRAVRREPPNDEALSGHRLYYKGLRAVRWVGEVHESELIADLERRNRVHSRHDPSRYAQLHHWIVPLKGAVVEVVAHSCEVRRLAPEQSIPIAFL
jgi:hypothetical protein